VPEPTYWESIKSESGAVLDRLKHLVHEGNVRSIRVRQGDRVVAVFPLTAGVVGLVVAPVLAAVATLLALLGDCSIDIEREETEKKKDGTSGSGEDRVAV
jgi:hypothetical protein